VDPVALEHKAYLPDATRILASFAAKLKFDDIPHDVVEHAKACILDSLGCNIYGASLPWTHLVADMVLEEGAKPQSTIFGMGRKTSPAGAVLVNSTACHAFELDDIHKLAMFHPGSIAVPVALALGEVRPGSTGRDMITALVAGYEVSLRVGVAATMALFFRGYHPQATLGTFTAGATAARMLNLDEEQTLHALGIAATQAAGLMAAQEGAMVKRMHSGRAAQSGVYAALLAARGFTGIVDVIEAGYGGFLSTISGNPDTEKLVTELGARWETAQVGFKPYASVTSIHTSLDALREIMAENRLKADDIVAVDVGLSPMTHLHCAWAYKAQGVTAAQMNLYFGLGAIAVDGEAFVDQYVEERLAEPAIMRFIEKINAFVDPEIEAMGAWGRHAVRLTVKTRDRRSFAKFIKDRRGSPENPLSKADREAKFLSLTARLLGEGRARRVIDIVAGLDSQNSLTALIGELSAFRQAA
jgi:2-methylcitrate dehydratase PrpD